MNHLRSRLVTRAKEMLLPRIRPLLPLRRPPNWYHNPRAGLLIGGGGGAALYYYKHRETFPYTNRTRFVLYSPTAERDHFDFESLKSVDGNLLPSDNPDYVRVRRILDRIVDAARRSGKSNIPDIFNWDLIVVKDDNKRRAFGRFCGKIFIYTGIFKACRTDAEIAWVIGHEVGHAISHHIEETITETIMYRIPYIILLRRQFRFFIQNIARLLLAEMVSQLLIHRPLWRRREIEADYIGLLLLALAGYDPRVVPNIYGRLRREDQSLIIKKTGFWVLIEHYLASHPSPNLRSQLTSQAMEEALAIYKNGIAAGNFMKV